METEILDALKPPWTYYYLIVIFLLVYGPRLFELRSAWMDIRQGRRKLEFEKEQLEIEKLRYEIEVLKKEHNISELNISTPVISPPARVKEQAQSAPVTKLRLPKYARLVNSILFVIQTITGVLMATSALITICMPFAIRSQKDFDTASIIFVTFVYALITWGFYIIFKRLRTYRLSIIVAR